MKFSEKSRAVSHPPENAYLFERGWGTYEPIEGLVKRCDAWILDELDPDYTGNMDTLILEYPQRVTIDDLELLRPAFEEKLPAAQASRLKTVTLRSFSVWDIPEVRNFPQDCGILLRLEAVRSSEIAENP
jgi:hypothetical protein